MYKKTQMKTSFWTAVILTLFIISSTVAQEMVEKVRGLQFAERIVAGGPDDFMTVRHLRFRGSQREIGKKLAEIAKSRNALQPFDQGVALAKKRRAFYQEYYPLHYQRALGAADLFGVTDDGSKDTMLLPYNCPDFGCSVVYYPPDHTATGNATLSRNYDFPTVSWAKMIGSPTQKDQRPTTADPYVIEVYPDKGYPSLYLCAYELLGSALDGINSEGLTVALLANSGKEPAKPSCKWQAGLSELEIVRYLLENCANVDEARKALSSVETYYFVVPCHYIIGDRHGNSFVWEYSLDLKHRFTIEGEKKVQWVTNHALHEYPKVKNIPASHTSSTFRRFKRLNDKINKSGKKHSVDTIKQINFCVRANEMSEGAVRTLWHALYNCEKRSLEIDFYLGETRSYKQKRSGYMHFKLDK